MDYEYSNIDGDKRGPSEGHWWLWRANFIGAVLAGSILIAALSSMATFGVMISFKAYSAQQLSCGQTLDEPDTPRQFSCGETFDEAHQRGCTFDPLTLSWLHPKCSLYGQEEFLEVSKNSTNLTWRYYEDKGGSHELGNYEALSDLLPESEYWMTQEQHLHHCMWMLMRAHDAAITPGKRLDSKSASQEHTLHCLEMMVKHASIGLGDRLAQVVVKGHSRDIGWAAC